MIVIPTVSPGFSLYLTYTYITRHLVRASVKTFVSNGVLLAMMGYTNVIIVRKE